MDIAVQVRDARTSRQLQSDPQEARRRLVVLLEGVLLVEDSARLRIAQPARQREDVEHDPRRVDGRVPEGDHTLLRAADHGPERDDRTELVLRTPEPRRRWLMVDNNIVVAVVFRKPEKLRERRVHGLKPMASRIASSGA
jgi:hypothetical protein